MRIIAVVAVLARARAHLSSSDAGAPTVRPIVALEAAPSAGDVAAEAVADAGPVGVDAALSSRMRLKPSPCLREALAERTRPRACRSRHV